jgi:beta-barrel assembly-enhancing protease
MHSNPKPTDQVPPSNRVWSGRATDGRTAASRTVDVSFVDEGLFIALPGMGSGVWLTESLRTAEPVRFGAQDVLVTNAAMPGATLYVADPAFAVALRAKVPHVALAAARKAGLKPGLAFGGAIFSLVAVVFALDLSPSKAVAKLMPDAARQKLGDSVLATLPSTKVCESPDGKAALDALTNRILTTTKIPGLKVQVLDWTLVNAFAVPGGRVVLTRAIIDKAANADEIAGVLAHELGHSIELHPEAGLVRSTGFWALVQMMFTGTPGVTGNLGNMLLQMAYNRGYEREADAIGLRLLKEAQISPKPFAGFFRRIDPSASKPDAEPKAQPKRRLFSNEMFDSHPAPPERIAMIEGQAPYPATPALTDAQWQALRTICGAAIVPSTPTAPALTVDEQLKVASARVAAEPGKPEVHSARGEIYYRAKRYPEAIADYARAIELNPANAAYRYGRGLAEQEAKAYAEAIIDYTEALRINPRYTAALAARGHVHRLQKNTAEAMKDLDAAIVLNARYQYALYERGLLNRELTRWADMDRDFSSVLELNKAYAFAYVRRGEAREKLGDKAKAIADYQAALTGSPSSSNSSEAFKLARERLVALGAPEK